MASLGGAEDLSKNVLLHQVMIVGGGRSLKTGRVVEMEDRKRNKPTSYQSGDVRQKPLTVFENETGLRVTSRIGLFLSLIN